MISHDQDPNRNSRGWFACQPPLTLTARHHQQGGAFIVGLGHTFQLIDELTAEIADQGSSVLAPRIPIVEVTAADR
jgi:hypothetical protein